MAKQDREIELKLELANGAAATFRALAILADLAPKQAKQISTYYDTPDYALRSEGFSLRVRASKGRFVQTVKRGDAGTAGLFDRPEWEEAIAGPEPDLDAAGRTPLGDVLTKKVRKKMEPLVCGEVTRTTWLIDREGAEIEIVLDEGTIRGGEAAQPVSEIELELVAGRRDALLAVAGELARSVPVQLGVLTKAERGYRLADGSARRAAKAEPISLDREMSTAAGLAAVCHSCLRQFRLNEPLVLAEQDPVALHHARVAMRRLRSAFALFRPVLAGDAVLAGLREEVRWLAGQLGDARNLDVLIKRVGHRSAPLCRLLKAERTRAYAQVLDALGSQRSRLLMLDLVTWVETGPWREGERAREPLEDFASAQLDKRWRKVRKAGHLLAGLDPEARHQLRIEIKKLRYAVEFLAALQRGRAAKRQKRFAAEIEAIQEELGHLNDAETARVLLLGLVGDRPDADALLAAAREDGRGPDEETHLAAAAEAMGRLVEIGRFWR